MHDSIVIYISPTLFVAIILEGYNIMGAYLKNTVVPELLSLSYGLRGCEIIQKDRLVGYDIRAFSLRIRGKGGKVRTVHIDNETEFNMIIAYYNDKENVIHFNTLYNRLKGSGLIEDHKSLRTVTHRGRKQLYQLLPPGEQFETYVKLSQELGHSLVTAMKYYNNARVDDRLSIIQSIRPKNIELQAEKSTS